MNILTLYNHIMFKKNNMEMILPIYKRGDGFKKYEYL